MLFLSAAGFLAASRSTRKPVYSGDGYTWIAGPRDNLRSRPLACLFHPASDPLRDIAAQVK